MWDYNTIRAPFFQITVAGKTLSDDRYRFIEEVTYEDHATGSDICSVTISDPNFEFISDPVFVTKAPFVLVGGYRMRHRKLLDGFISAVDYIFPEDNTPQFIIHAMDKSHKMDGLLKKRTWKNKSRYEVAKIVAQENGFTFSGHATKLSTKKEESISQSNQTDIEFIIGLADECELIVYIKDNTVYFQARSYMQSASSNFNYRKPPFDILSFSPRVVQKDLPEEEEDSDIDDKGKKQTGKADGSTPRTTPGNSGKPLNQVQKDYGSGPQSGSGSKLVYSGGDLKFVPGTKDDTPHRYD